MQDGAVSTASASAGKMATMQARVAGRFERRLPADDDHPYRTGAWRPNLVEYDADQLRVVEGRIPADLDGVYLRNTENPLLPSLGVYHPFDGDGMLHAIRFCGGVASYRNRAVRTAGLAAELQAGAPLWAGIVESPAKSLRDGWGARTRLKDASSTDVVVHAGRALTTFYQCGDVYQLDPVSLAQHGAAPWGQGLGGWGVSAHPKLDGHTGELLIFAYATEAPYFRYGVLDAAGRLVHATESRCRARACPTTSRSPSASPSSTICRCSGSPSGSPRASTGRDFHPSCRRASASCRATRAATRCAGSRRARRMCCTGSTPTSTVTRSFWTAIARARRCRRRTTAGAPGPGCTGRSICGPWGRARIAGASICTGRTREEPLAEQVCEFPTIHGRYAGRRHRYVYAMTTRPGWFLFDGLLRHDVQTGELERYAFGDGVYGSESPMAPRVGGTDEDDGYVVSFVSDVGRDTCSA